MRRPAGRTRRRVSSKTPGLRIAIADTYHYSETHHVGLSDLHCKLRVVKDDATPPPGHPLDNLELGHGPSSR